MNCLRHSKAVSGICRQQDPLPATPIRTAYIYRMETGWASGGQYSRNQQERYWMSYLSKYLIVVHDACTSIYTTVKLTCMYILGADIWNCGYKYMYVF